MGLGGTMSAWRPCERHVDRKRRKTMYACMHLHMHQREITPHLQGDPGNDVHGVDHVTQGFAHLSAVGVPHHRMQVYLQQKCELITLYPRASTEPDLTCAVAFTPPAGDSPHLLER